MSTPNFGKKKRESHRDTRTTKPLRNPWKNIGHNFQSVEFHWSALYAFCHPSGPITVLCSHQQKTGDNIYDRKSCFISEMPFVKNQLLSTKLAEMIQLISTLWIIPLNPRGTTLGFADVSFMETQALSKCLLNGKIWEKTWATKRVEGEIGWLRFCTQFRMQCITQIHRFDWIGGQLESHVLETILQFCCI